VSTSGGRVKKLRLETEWERWTNSAVPKQDKHVKNPIRWWWNRRFEYPVLYRIAMDIFSIPAMSSECERVFSQLRRLITFERTRLGDDTVESDECQKHWLASGCLALKDSDGDSDSEPQQRVEGDDVEQSDGEPAIILIASPACD
jgi:hAT family C-terminal dimerisation region